MNMVTNLILDLEDILSTEERIKILDNIIYLEREFGVNEIAKKTSLSKGLVSKYFEILAESKVLSRKVLKFIVDDNIKVKSLKILLNLLKIETKIFHGYKFVKAVGLYGSCAKGTNTESSDVDLWIKVSSAKEGELAEMSSELRKKIKNVKLLILDDGKVKKLKKEDNLFYHSLYFGSIILYGDENGI